MFRTLRRWYKRPSNPAGHVYYVRLKTPQGNFYKLGYTSKPSLMERFAFSGHGDEKLVDREFFFSFQPNAWDLEQTLLEHFDKQRAFGKFSNDPKHPLSGRGQSELFFGDVLGLDEELYRTPPLKAVEPGPSNLETQTNGCLLALLGLALAPFTLGFSLVFILGGGFDLFSDTSRASTTGRTQPVHPSLHRPQHSPAIRDVVALLIQRKGGRGGGG